MYRSIRYDTIASILNIVIAPFGNVKFKTYLIAEIFTDCLISIQDLGRVAFYLETDLWTNKVVNLSDPLIANRIHPAIKWVFYCLSFLPYMWRMNQNLRKWLVYDHKLQAFNALKYFILMIASICAIIYYETDIKALKYLYYSLKTLGCAYKYFWDVYYDWGLFHGSRKDNKFLRNQMKYPPWFYYISIVYNLFGLYSWAICIGITSLITPVETTTANTQKYHNNVMWIIWLEFFIVAIRRTIWVVIRVESEFYNNFEQFRDIVTIPPIKFDE